ncbi:MAG: peptidoglycan DD-metalloendopeptidase family protein [Puniceicoccaceae bacterium]
MSRLWLVALFLFQGLHLVHGDALPLVWPTPNRAFIEGKGGDFYLQPTASGRLESALFGCVRNGGKRFHEGIDLKPLQRTSTGEAADPIFAISPGRVVYINSSAGRSSYGRYIVLEHQHRNVRFYSLYSHLARIEEGLVVGREVLAGTRIGTMGRSAGGYSIPKHRAHLHLEIGLQLSSDFERWFERSSPGSINHHGRWNGLNLVGFDPLDFYGKVMEGMAVGVADYLTLVPVAVEVRYFSSRFPDLLERSPGLITGGAGSGKRVAWDIGFTWFGLPVRWTPRFQGEGLEEAPTGTLKILRVNPGEVEKATCRSILIRDGQSFRIGEDLRRYIAILF